MVLKTGTMILHDKTSSSASFNVSGFLTLPNATRLSLPMLLVFSRGISGELVKELFYANPNWFRELLNTLLLSGQFPEVWERARIALIPKENRDLTRPQDYRPICILSCWGKVLNKVITERLSFYLETRNLLNSLQFGFMKRRSTIDALQSIKDFIQLAHNRNHLTCIIPLDIANAFNSANWTILKRKVSILDIPVYLKRIIFDFLKDRYVIIDDHLHYYNTDALSVLAGIPPLNITLKHLLRAYHLKSLKKDLHLPQRTIQFLELEDKPDFLPPCENFTINWTHYNQETNGIKIFTDGSKMEQKTGSAFAVYQDGEEISHVSVRLNDEATVYLAELNAIDLAVNYVLEHNFAKLALGLVPLRELIAGFSGGRGAESLGRVAVASPFINLRKPSGGALLITESPY
ncbi:uncharacterized protein CDAR_276531 [Caerostris darwini]|uniref:Reverse transcriptase domain-containing protein n=1 Tax=Caerostris darwini TaxID=1538125 RepID=A0AAV4N183_9ARAC|nr:uncharacterized protein CDAR_276531 [Caerostris darwini]